MYKSLDYVVKNVMIEDYQENDQRYVQYLQMAIMGARELSFILPHNIKTIKYDAEGSMGYYWDSNKGYIDLPSDFITYSKIGIVDGDRLNVLGVNDKMPFNLNTDNCGDIVRPASATGDALFFNFMFGGDVGCIFGFGSGSPLSGSYRLNLEHSRIEFSSDVCTSEIYMEYKSNGIQSDGTALIPEEAIMALVEWVHWRRLRFLKGADKFDIEAARKAYIAAKKQLRSRLPMTLEEFTYYTSHYYMQAPK